MVDEHEVLARKGWIEWVDLFPLFPDHRDRLAVGCADRRRMWGGEEPRPTALDSVGPAPPGQVLLLGSLLRSGLLPPYEGIEVEINGGQTVLTPDQDGLVAGFVPCSSALEVRVRTRDGGTLLQASARTPAADMRVVRLDPSLRTTAQALVRRARPDLAEAAARAPSRLAPLEKALDKALQAAGKGEKDVAAFTGSLELDSQVTEAVARVLPDLEDCRPGMPCWEETPLRRWTSCPRWT